VLLASLVATVGVLAVRGLGWLQGWEGLAFDQLVRLRPPEALDQRLLIVTITEEDLRLPEQAQGKGSLSDVALTKLLQRLTPLKPRAIGIDVYRDVPASAPPLTALLNQQPHVFTICKVGDATANYPEIPPPVAWPRDRLGFSDVILDADEVLRRHLVFMDRTPGAACSTPYALSTQLALHYLKPEGITPNYTPAGNLRLGDRTFQRLHHYRGSYQRADLAGYQILLNYRNSSPTLSPAPTITLKEVLAGRLQPEDGRDRIILIGVTAPSSKDYLRTPYGQKIPGVLIQAHMTSQLISAVQDGRDPIAVWLWPAEIAWIGLWALGGGVLGWRCRSLPWLLVLQVPTLAALSVLCFYGLRQSYWVPLVPAALGVIVTSGSMAWIKTKQP
jgi:CHASE2 domain-containing sensor protein